MRTAVPKASEITRKWHLFDASGQVLGRLSSQIAALLMGKHKTIFARYMDMADHVVVVNAAKIAVTGNKEQKKLYRRHSGYPGGFRENSLSDLRKTRPELILLRSVSGMLPKNKLRHRLLKHLHIYPGPSHPYTKNFPRENKLNA